MAVRRVPQPPTDCVTSYLCAHGIEGCPGAQGPKSSRKAPTSATVIENAANSTPEVMPTSLATRLKTMAELRVFLFVREVSASALQVLHKQQALCPPRAHARSIFWFQGSTVRTVTVSARISQEKLDISIS